MAKKDKVVEPKLNTDKIRSAISLLEEKLSRECGIPLSEIKSKTISITNGELQILNK